MKPENSKRTNMQLSQFTSSLYSMATLSKGPGDPPLLFMSLPHLALDVSLWRASVSSSAQSKDSSVSSQVQIREYTQALRKIFTDSAR